MIFRGTARAVIVALVASTSYVVSADEMHIDSAFGVPQTVNGDNHDDIARHMAQCNHYMMDVKDKDQDLFDNCKNEHELCTHWALTGQCRTNPQEMHEMCGPACQACDPSIHTAFVEEEEEDEEEGEEVYGEEYEEEDETEVEEDESEVGGDESVTEAGEEEEEDATEFDEEAFEGEEEEETESAEEAEEKLAVEV